MERIIMELITHKPRRPSAAEEAGFSLIEMMIAMIVLAIGILGSMTLVVMAINGDFRSKQQSNSTALAQMVTEKIMSIPAYTAPTLSLTDCTGASYNIATAVGGATVASSGDIDFTQATVANYYMPYTDCATLGRQATYDVRWHVSAPTDSSIYTKILTVSARLKFVKTNSTSGSAFGPVVTIKTLVGQGT